MRTLSLQDPAALRYFPPRARGLDLYNERALPVDALDALPRALTHLRLSTLAAPDLAPIAHHFPALRSLAVALQGMARDALTALSTLTALTEADLWLSDEGVPSLAPLAHLDALTLVRVIDGPGLARELGALPALRELTFYAREADAAVLASAAALPALEHLKVRFGEPRHPDALCALSGAPALRSLELSNIHALSAAEVAAIAAIPTLTSLSLELRASGDLAQLQPLREAGLRLLVTIPRGAAPQDRLLVELARALPDVVALDLSDAPVHGFSDAGFSALCGLKRLEWLDVGELPSAVKSAALTWLSDPPALAHLSLGGRSLGAKLVDTLRDCAALRTLHLKRFKLTDGAAKKLSRLPLEALGVTGASLTDEGFIALSQVKTLRALDLQTDAGAMSDVGLAAIATLPALRDLELEIRNNFEVTSLAPLAAMTALERLSVAPLSRAGGGGGDLAGLSGAPALWAVGSLGGGNSLDEATARALRGIPNLLRVNGFADGQDLLAGHALVEDTTSRVIGAVTPPMRAQRGAIAPTSAPR